MRRIAKTSSTTKSLTAHAPSLHYELTSKSLQDIVNYFDIEQLELSPPFQRKSVWSERDRSKLIDSLVSGFPVPSIYLYERRDKGHIVYDVIDGKQRLESVLMFMGRLRGRFDADVLWPGASERQKLNWKAMQKHDQVHSILSYRIPTVIVRGELADIIELFVRINSTGKALTAAERRHARYNTSPFLKAAEKLAAKFAGAFRSNKVMSDAQIARMKHIELMCELMLASHRGDVQHKKAALESVMDRKAQLTAHQIKVAQAKTIAAINRVFSVLPNIKQTRFRQISDFYSLVVMLQKFETEKLVLNDRKRNRLAGDILTALGTGVDTLKEKTRRFAGSTDGEVMFRRYAETVAEGTDTHPHRVAREKVLRLLVCSLFEQKDSRRLFSAEQRRLLWNTSKERRCTECDTQLTWDDFTIDHIEPFSRGGKTALSNAALMCRTHNSAKGSRRRRAA